MAGQFRVRNWDRWQTYRRDRPSPPWIKLYKRILLDPDFVSLSDAERSHLILIWMVAAERNGVIPDDPKVIQRLICSDVTPDLDRFLSLQLLEKTGKRRRRKTETCDAPEAEAKAKAKAKADIGANAPCEAGASRPINGVEIREVLSYLNDQAGTGFRWAQPNGQPTRHADLVRAVLKKGYTVEDCKTVIDRKASEWRNDEKMAQYLRPSTLFRISNFEAYLDG